MRSLETQVGRSTGINLMRFRFTPAKPLTRSPGFTLIEVMIAVAIVGVLAAIALPSCNSYMAKVRRADAREQLVQAAQFSQRFYTANEQFARDRAVNSVLSSSDGMPDNLRRSPADNAAIYQLNTSITAAGYYAATITQAPTHSQWRRLPEGLLPQTLAACSLLTQSAFAA